MYLQNILCVGIPPYEKVTSKASFCINSYYLCDGSAGTRSTRNA